MRKRYLGDSVYIEPWCGDGVVVYTDNGDGAKDTIYFEPAVIDAFLSYVENLREALANPEEEVSEAQPEKFKLPLDLQFYERIPQNELNELNSIWRLPELLQKKLEEKK